MKISRKSLTSRWQVFAAYGAGALAVLEAVDLFSGHFELPGWLFTAAVLLLLLGLPLGLLLSHWLSEPGTPDPERTSDHSRPPEPGPSKVRGTSSVGRFSRLTWRGAGAAFLGVLALWGLVAAGWIAVTMDERRALQLRARALTELPRLAESGDFDAAHEVAREIERALPGDSVVRALRLRFSAPFEIESRPAGATVHRRPYPGGQWELLGQTPLTAVLPLTVSRLRFEKEGYRPADLLSFGYFGPLFDEVAVLEPESSDVSGEMIRVPGGDIGVLGPGLEHLPVIRLGDYYIDRHEVTNRDYYRFIEAGGYRDQSYWREPFRDGDRTLSFQVAMARFTDRTGRPGPATWEAGNYPAGAGDRPVGGLSWYEAAAYARFVGAALPTLYHWFNAAGVWLSPYVVPGSNFGGEGPTAVGAFENMGRYGAYDMGGNVREWAWNESRDGRYILGGGWNDEPYTFVDPVAQPPFDRSPTNGLRLARFTVEDGLYAAREPIPLPFRDYGAETPVDDPQFAIFRRMYDYDRGPLEPEIESADTTDAWIRQRVTFNAAYGGDRVIAHVFLPRRTPPPHQTVIYFPGSLGFQGGTSDPPQDVAIADFIVRSGRALIRPILKSTFERQDDRTHDQPDMSIDYRDHVVMWVKDIRRSVDYAEERADLQTEPLGYYGVSWGGRLGGLVVPIETRFDAAVLYVAGLKFQHSLPEADPWHFLPRFTVPVLMLNGQYDNFFPLETSQKPMFRALGTPPQHKRHIVDEGGHFVPRSRLVQETLDWFDRYLGPVR